MSSKKKNFVHLVRLEGEMEAEAVQSLLSAHDILSTKKYGSHPGPSIGIFSSDGNPFGGIDIYVREEDKEKAQKIVEKKDINDNEGKEESRQNYSKKENKNKLIFKIFAIFFLISFALWFFGIIYLFFENLFK